MGLNDEVLETSEKIVEMLERKRSPLHYENIIRDIGLNPYRKEDRETMSKALNFLEEDGVIKRIRSDGPYALKENA